jgi:Fe-S cluster assembly protein SufD
VTALPGSEDARARRLAALERFEATPLPTESLEEWRYSRIGELELDRYRPAPAPASPAGLPPDLAALAAEEGAVVLTTCDGWLGPLPELPAGVEVSDAGSVGAVSGEPDPFVSLSAALAPTPIRVRVADGAVLAGPLVIAHHGATDGVITFPRVVLEVGRQAEAVLVEVSESDDVDLLTVPVTELVVGDGAHLHYVHLQSLGPRAWQIGLQASQVGRDASLTSTAVALGGHYARLRTASALTGPGGETRLNAAYFASGHQMHDFRTVQDHRTRKAFSDLVYKGVVANQARSVYTGLIRVEKGASGTNALQTNRNLVLHEGAHAESVPNLEIEDNDVRCTHASAVGPVAADQRFYLESRGVPADVAERLIALGFLDEILERLPVASLAAHLRAAVAEKLDRADAAEAELAGAGA